MATMIDCPPRTVRRILGIRLSIPYSLVVVLLFLNWVFDIVDWISRHT